MAEGKGNEEMQVKGYKLPAIKLIHSEDLLCSMMIVINNNVLYTFKDESKF